MPGMSASLATATAASFIWLGMVLGISFIEAPLKFRAPGVTLGIGLGILLGTFVYALTVLRSVRSADESRPGLNGNAEVSVLPGGVTAGDLACRVDARHTRLPQIIGLDEGAERPGLELRADRIERAPAAWRRRARRSCRRG